MIDTAPLTDFSLPSAKQPAGSALRIVNSLLPTQPDGSPGDQPPISAPWAQILAGSLYRLLEEPNARYQAYRDLLKAVKGFQIQMLATATQRAAEPGGRSEYGAAWLTWPKPGLTVLERNAPATNQVLELDIGVASPSDRVARGAATLTIARGRIQGASFVADSVRSVGITATTTLRKLADAINGVNSGITASLSGHQLLLTGNAPGARNAFQLTLSGAISRDWSFDPALYDASAPPRSVILYRPAADAVVAPSAPPGGLPAQGDGGSTLAAHAIAAAVGDLLSAVSAADAAGVLTLADPLLTLVGSAVRDPLLNGAYGVSLLRPSALGLSFTGSGLNFDVSRHLTQYAADPLGTRSAIDDLSATLAGQMTTPVSALDRQIELLRQGVLLGVAEDLRNGKSLAEAVTAYADALVLGTWKPAAATLVRG
jgi:hypothetical protein